MVAVVVVVALDCKINDNISVYPSILNRIFVAVGAKQWHSSRNRLKMEANHFIMNFPFCIFSMFTFFTFGNLKNTFNLSSSSQIISHFWAILPIYCSNNVILCSFHVKCQRLHNSLLTKRRQKKSAKYVAFTAKLSVETSWGFLVKLIPFSSYVQIALQLNQIIWEFYDKICN